MGNHPNVLAAQTRVFWMIYNLLILPRYCPSHYSTLLERLRGGLILMYSFKFSALLLFLNVGVSPNISLPAVSFIAILFIFLNSYVIYLTTILVHSYYNFWRDTQKLQLRFIIYKFLLKVLFIWKCGLLSKFLG